MYTEDAKVTLSGKYRQVDLVTKDPSIALDAHRKATFVTAAVFKQLVPVSMT